MTVAFQKTRLELPEEESGEGTVFQVCVEVLSPGILERPVDVYLTLEEGSATGEGLITSLYVTANLIMEITNLHISSLAYLNGL